MKKFPLKFIVIGCTILFICTITISIIVFLVLFNGKSSSNNSNGNSTVSTSKNSPEVENLVEIQQKDLFVNSFISEEGPMRNTHIVFMSSLILDTSSNMVKSLQIFNFDMKTNKGQGVFVAPPATPISTNCFSYLGGPCTDDVKENQIVSSLVNGKYSCNMVLSVKNKNECLNQQSISPMFNIIQKNVGTFNYEQIFELNNGYDGGKILNYSNLTANDLNSEINFTVQIEFNNGKIWNKKFKAVIDGNRVLENSFYTVNMTTSD